MADCDPRLVMRLGSPPVTITDLHDYLATFVAAEPATLSVDTLYRRLIQTCREIRSLFDELAVCDDIRRIRQIDIEIRIKCRTLVERKVTLDNGMTQSIDDCRAFCNCAKFDSCVTCGMHRDGFNLQDVKGQYNLLTLHSLHSFYTPHSARSTRVSQCVDMRRVMDFSDKIHFCGVTLPYYINVISVINK
jgi:hypothetical protein